MFHVGLTAFWVNVMARCWIPLDMILLFVRYNVSKVYIAWKWQKQDELIEDCCFPTVFFNKASAKLCTPSSQILLPVKSSVISVYDQWSFLAISPDKWTSYFIILQHGSQVRSTIISDVISWQIQLHECLQSTINVPVKWTKRNLLSPYLFAMHSLDAVFLDH